MIVVDTSPFFHGPMLATLDRTDELLLVCGLDVPTIKNVRLSLADARAAARSRTERIRIVLNRANSKVGIKRGEVEAALETKVALRDARATARSRWPSTAATAVALPIRSADFSRGVREHGQVSCRPTPRPRRRRSGWRGKSLAKAAEEPMGLHDRLKGADRRAGRRAGRSAGRHGGRPQPRQRRERRRGRPVRGAEDPRPPRVHRQARARSSSRPRRPRTCTSASLRAVMEQLALDRTPLTREERRADRPRDHGRHPRLRAARAVPPRRLVTEVMVNGFDQIYVERAGKIERTHVDVRRRRAPAADHRQDRLAGRPPHRRVLADGRRAPARRQPRQRDHPAARRCAGRR